MIRQALGGAQANAGRLVSLPAPVGGWNTRDSLAQMRSTDAVYLDNFFPYNSDVMLRKGRQTLCTLPAGLHIRTLLGYKSPAAAVKQFAAVETGIYDITVPASPFLAISATKADWQSANVSTAGGHFLLACNGQDKLKLYDGALWKDIDGASVPAVTGITTTDIANISQYKSRVIFCKNNSLSFWYLPTNAIAGAATEFPLQSIFSKGGYLMATFNWTIDGGNGPDDYFVAVTSEGEVVVYVGTDVAAADFRKVGVFQLPAPIGRRCFCQLSDDVLLMTKGAIYPLAKSLGKGLSDKRLSLTDKIDKVYNTYSQLYSGIFGWEMAFFPEATMVLVNIPIKSVPSQDIVYSQQFVVNTMTQSWCRFVSWNAETISAFNGKLYCALGNRVWELWTGTSDDTSEIVGKAKTSFQALGSAANKHVSMVRPIIQAGATLTIQLAVDMDYRNNLGVTSATTLLAELSLWDSAIWNASRWNGGSAIIANWATANSAVGRVAAVRLRVASKSATMSWIATDLILNDAGYI